MKVRGTPRGDGSLVSEGDEGRNGCSDPARGPESYLQGAPLLACTSAGRDLLQSLLGHTSISKWPAFVFWFQFNDS